MRITHSRTSFFEVNSKEKFLFKNITGGGHKSKMEKIAKGCNQKAAVRVASGTTHDGKKHSRGERVGCSSLSKEKNDSPPPPPSLFLFCF
jgi:hypothetical protein